MNQHVSDMNSQHSSVSSFNVQKCVESYERNEMSLYGESSPLRKSLFMENMNRIKERKVEQKRKLRKQKTQESMIYSRQEHDRLQLAQNIRPQMQSEEIVRFRPVLKREEEVEEAFESDMSKNWTDEKVIRMRQERDVQIKKWRNEVLG